MQEKSFKALKPKKKFLLNELMFREVCDYYSEHGELPTAENLDAFAMQSCKRVKRVVQNVTIESLYEEFLRRQKRFAERLQKHGVPELPKPKPLKTEEEKKAIKRAHREHKRQRKQERLKQKQAQEMLEQLEQDEDFFIAGYTSGGVPFGVTWEEMGLEPGEEIHDETKAEIF